MNFLTLNEENNKQLPIISFKISEGEGVCKDEDKNNYSENRDNYLLEKE